MTNYTIIQNDTITSNLTDGAFRLYTLLQSMAYGNKTEVFPSQQYLSEKLHKSIRTIQRYLNEFIQAGYISKRRRGSISNVYTLLHKIISDKINNAVDRAKNAYNTFKKNSKAKSNSNINLHAENYPRNYGSIDNLEQQLLDAWESKY